MSWCFILCNIWFANALGFVFQVLNSVQVSQQLFGFDGSWISWKSRSLEFEWCLKLFHLCYILGEIPAILLGCVSIFLNTSLRQISSYKFHRDLLLKRQFISSSSQRDTSNLGVGSWGLSLTLLFFLFSCVPTPYAHHWWVLCINECFSLIFWWILIL